MIFFFLDAKTNVKPKQQQCFNSQESSRYFHRLEMSAKKFCGKYRHGWMMKVDSCMEKTCSQFDRDMAGKHRLSLACKNQINAI
jgi:hypothetical protein